jgi:HD superfamily phosphohydrolase
MAHESSTSSAFPGDEISSSAVTSNSLDARRKVTIFNDCVHHHMELDRVSTLIIDTPQFQRLRDIGQVRGTPPFTRTFVPTGGSKHCLQVGGVYHVFPSACHKRFEHSVGVAYLGRTFIRMLASAQPEVGITESDCLCIEIAGLCHDLGHGIMSHMFDRMFIPRACGACSWEHEHASIAMLDHLIKENDLQRPLEKAGLTICHVDTEEQFAAYRAQQAILGFGDAAFPDCDLHFIKELILGDPKEAPAGWVWRGAQGRRIGAAGISKQFLFELVANKRNSVDVDKLDYFSRDCKQLNVAIPFDASRLMRFGRVVTLESGMTTIGYASKEAWNVYQLFSSRYSLHKRAYQHRVARVVETMFTEALLLADAHLRFEGSDGRMLKISESIWDMKAYAKVTDYVLRMIANSSDALLGPARNLIHRIERRDFYTFIGETLWDTQRSASLSPEPSPDTAKRSRAAAGLDGTPAPLQRPDSYGADAPWPRRRVIRARDGQRIQEELHALASSLCDEDMKVDDLLVEIITINMGMGDKNPVDSVMFYHVDKISSELIVAPISRHQVSVFVPHIFEEQYVRLYCKHAAHAPVVREAFDSWCEARSSGVPLPFSPARLGKKPRLAAPTDGVQATKLF